MNIIWEKSLINFRKQGIFDDDNDVDGPDSSVSAAGFGKMENLSELRLKPA